MFRLPKIRNRQRSRGQSLVEFALVLPVILLLTLIALDFGRVYLGYINLQNMARIAANFAADNPDTDWTVLTDPTVQQFKNQIVNDAKATNCTLPVVAGVTTVPTPTYGTATRDLGDLATVAISCNFRLITPVISNIVGTNGNLAVSASSVFPIKEGLSGTSGAVLAAPVAAFTGTPTNGTNPLTVAFTDQSTNGPVTFLWDFGDGVTSTDQDPTHTYTVAQTYTVKLTATNPAGSGTLTKTDYISVSSPAIVVDFTATPTIGPKPLTVQFTGTSTVPPTAWAWDFGDGTAGSTATPSHQYAVVGTYTVKLTATYPTGPAVSKTILNMITVTVGTCTVPDFVGISSSLAQALWASKNFTTTVDIQGGSQPWIIGKQNQTVGQVIPCDSPITVKKN